MYGKWRHPQHCWCPEACRVVLPCSPGMGIDGAHNTVGQNIGAHNTAWVLIGLEGCRAPFWHVLSVLSYRCTGYGPWYYGLTWAFCLTCSACFLEPHRAGILGRSVLVDFTMLVGEESYAVVGCIPGRRRGSESAALLARPSGRRGGSESEASNVPWLGLPVREVGQSQKQGMFLLSQAFQSERRAKVGSGRHSSLARPSDRRLDHPSGLSLGFWAGPGFARHLQHHLLGWAFAEK
jgi:hypothetical protein